MIILQIPISRRHDLGAREGEPRAEGRAAQVPAVVPRPRQGHLPRGPQGDAQQARGRQGQGGEGQAA